jgi:hypothetical protein
VNTGYFVVQEAAAGSTMTVNSTSNDVHLGLTVAGVNTNPMMIALDIVQPGSSGDVLVHAHVLYRSFSGTIVNYRAGCIMNGGSGWTDGVRITVPAAFVANVGRIVVLGLKP